ncbi:MAG: hypothetical protein ACREPE_08155 [Lysobacter sp.]
MPTFLELLMTLQRPTVLVFSLILLALTALVYWPGINGGFLFDDYPNILTNTAIQMETLSWDALARAARAYEGGLFGRPLATISFALDYLNGGKSPRTYKLTSLAVHLANALLVFWLVRRLLALALAGPRWAHWAAFSIALLWAIHPLQVSTVLYVVQRMETLSLTFVLLALVGYLHGRVLQRDGSRGWPWLALSVLLAGMGMLSKETAILFPAYAFALELTVLGFEARSPRTTRNLKLAYGSGIIVALVLFFALLPGYIALEAFAGRDFTMYERLLSQLRVLPRYLGQMLLPLPASLPFYYDDYTRSTGWLRPGTTLAGGLLVLTLLVAAWKARRSLPLVSLGILWFFAAHLLTSNVFNVELVFEHRNYFALLGILIAGADLIRRIPVQNTPVFKAAGIAAIVVAFGFLGGVRSAVWGDPLLLAMDMAAKNANSARASNDLGEQYMNMSGMDPNSPFYGMAVLEFERGSRLPSSSPLPEQALILMAASSGQAPHPDWWPRLIQKIRTRPLGPQEQGAIVGLMQQRYKGLVLDDQELGKALAILFERSGISMPAHAYALYADYALTYLGDEALADRLFVQAIERNANDADYAARIFGALTADGRTRQAQAVYQRARELGLMTGPPTDKTPTTVR